MMIVKVYDGDWVGWTLGLVTKEYITAMGVITTIDGTELRRHLKTSTEHKKDGCGYILPQGYKIKAKINYDLWMEELEMQAESWDNPTQFRNYYLSNIDKVYEFELFDMYFEVTRESIPEEEYQAICEYKHLILLDF